MATVVIDPQALDRTGRRRAADVAAHRQCRQRNGRRWYGQLAWNGALPTPGTGSLYLANWSQLDPYAPGNAAGDAEPAAVHCAERPAQPGAQRASAIGECTLAIGQPAA